MRSYVRTVRFITATAVSLLLASCATTDVTAVWRDQDYRKQPKKVLIQAMLKNATSRRILEDEFTAHFRYRGIEAVPAYTVLPGDELPSLEALKAQVQTGGFDALLLTRIVEEKKKRRVVRGSVTPAPYPVAPRHGGWPGYYGGGYATVYSPSYSVEDRFAIAETSLYDAATEKLIWTATSETWLADPARKLVKTYVNVMMDSLRRQKIVP